MIRDIPPVPEPLNRAIWERFFTGWRGRAGWRAQVRIMQRSQSVPLLRWFRWILTARLHHLLCGHLWKAGMWLKRLTLHRRECS
jgi:hypothetical protein